MRRKSPSWSGLQRNIATRVGTFEPPGDGHITGRDWAGLAGSVLVDTIHLTNRLIRQRGLDRCAFRGLGDLLDCALSALLERQLAAEGIAQIDNANNDEGENGRDKRQFDHSRSAILCAQFVEATQIHAINLTIFVAEFDGMPTPEQAVSSGLLMAIELVPVNTT